jgi:hypothetical protein
MITGGSWSVWQSFPLLSRAGAAGRIALVEEGAKLLGVSPQACTARNSAVHANGKSISYGDIVARGDLRRTFTPEQLQTMPIKRPAERRLIGKDVMALDVPSKVNGKARYGLDAVVEGTTYARPLFTDLLNQGCEMCKRFWAALVKCSSSPTVTKLFSLSRSTFIDMMLSESWLSERLGTKPSAQLLCKLRCVSRPDRRFLF